MKIWQIVKKNLKIIIVLCIVSLISNIAKIFSSYLLQKIIENFSNFTYYLCFFLVLLCISYIGQFLFEYLVKHFSIAFQTSENIKIANLIYSMKYADIEINPPIISDRLVEIKVNIYVTASSCLSAK